MRAPAPLLEGVDLHRTFRLPRTSLFGERRERHALQGVSVSLPPGGSLGIVGESGSGKTTLIRLLLALDTPTAGSVRFDGREVEPGSPRRLRWYRRAAQVVLQDPASSLDPRLPVGASVREPLTCLGVDGDHDERVVEVFEAVGLDPDLRDRYPHELSGGQQQRIAIARAIAPRPRLLVGDEPVSSLDVSVRVQILDLLGDIAARLDLAIILVSHDLGVVQALCDDVLVLRAGEAVEHGRTADVLSSPSHPYTQALIDAVPRLTGTT